MLARAQRITLATVAASRMCSSGHFSCVRARVRRMSCRMKNDLSRASSLSRRRSAVCAQWCGALHTTQFCVHGHGRTRVRTPGPPVRVAFKLRWRNATRLGLATFVRQRYSRECWPTLLLLLLLLQAARGGASMCSGACLLLLLLA